MCIILTVYFLLWFTYVLGYYVGHGTVTSHILSTPHPTAVRWTSYETEYASQTILTIPFLPGRLNIRIGQDRLELAYNGRHNSYRGNNHTFACGKRMTLVSDRSVEDKAINLFSLCWCAGSAAQLVLVSVTARCSSDSHWQIQIESQTQLTDRQRES
jgi:hypothetical protein